MDTFQPVAEDSTEYELAPTSTKNMEALDRLKLRAPCVGEEQRRQIAENYGCDDVGEAMERYCEDDTLLSPPRFWEEAAKVVVRDLTDKDVEEGGIDFAEARRAVANFSNAGNEELLELLSGIGASFDSKMNQEAQT